jgi:hypothetical protein
MARTRRHTAKAVITLEELPQPAPALTEEQAERVYGGSNNLMSQKRDLRGAQAVFDDSTDGQSYTMEDFIGDVGG